MYISNSNRSAQEDSTQPRTIGEKDVSFRNQIVQM